MYPVVRVHRPMPDGFPRIGHARTPAELAAAGALPLISLPTPVPAPEPARRVQKVYDAVEGTYAAPITITDAPVSRQYAIQRATERRQAPPEHSDTWKSCLGAPKRKPNCPDFDPSRLDHNDQSSFKRFKSGSGTEAGWPSSVPSSGWLTGQRTYAPPPEPVFIPTPAYNHNSGQSLAGADAERPQLGDFLFKPNHAQSSLSAQAPAVAPPMQQTQSSRYSQTQPFLSAQIGPLEPSVIKSEPSLFSEKVPDSNIKQEPQSSAQTLLDWPQHGSNEVPSTIIHEPQPSGQILQGNPPYASHPTHGPADDLSKITEQNMPMISRSVSTKAASSRPSEVIDLTGLSGRSASDAAKAAEGLVSSSLFFPEHNVRDRSTIVASIKAKEAGNKPVSLKEWATKAEAEQSKRRGHDAATIFDDGDSQLETLQVVSRKKSRPCKRPTCPGCSKRADSCICRASVFGYTHFVRCDVCRVRKNQCTAHKGGFDEPCTTCRKNDYQCTFSPIDESKAKAPTVFSLPAATHSTASLVSRHRRQRQGSTDSSESQATAPAYAPPTTPDPAISELRPTIGQKTVPEDWRREYLRALDAEALEESDDESDESEAEDEPTTYFVYTIMLKQWYSHSSEEDAEEFKDRESYCDLNEANAAVLRKGVKNIGHGFTWTTAMDEEGMVSGLLVVANMSYRIWLMREVRLCPTPRRLSNSCKVLPKKVYSIEERYQVNKKHSASTPPHSLGDSEASAYEELWSRKVDDNIYTTLELANQRAAEHVLTKYILGEAPKTRRLDDIDLWKLKRREEMHERVETCNEHREGFYECLQVKDGKASSAQTGDLVTVWVETLFIDGPRN